MKVLRTPDEVVAWRDTLSPTLRVAMVPTMGFLHKGHLSLLREGRRLVGSGRVLLTIFVNPSQFGPGEDLDVYPRDEAGDLAKAAVCGADVAFCPTNPKLMYPSLNTWVNVEKLSGGLCGASRPNHFRGVCTIVAKLWSLARPDFGVFGEKDFQQLAILTRMHADLFLRGEVVSMPIVREADGLAMSSRNARLSEPARAAALAVPTFVRAVRQRFERGDRTSEALLHDADGQLAPGVIDYVALVDARDLSPVDTVRRPARVALAVRFGDVRLIDNALLSP